MDVQRQSDGEVSTYIDWVNRDSLLAPDPVVEAYKKDVDVSLLQRNLRLTVEERFRQLMELQRFALALREAGRKARAPDR